MTNLPACLTSVWVKEPFFYHDQHYFKEIQLLFKKSFWLQVQCLGWGCSTYDKCTFGCVLQGGHLMLRDPYVCLSVLLCDIVRSKPIRNPPLSFARMQRVWFNVKYVWYVWIASLNFHAQIFCGPAKIFIPKLPLLLGILRRWQAKQRHVSASHGKHAPGLTKCSVWDKAHKCPIGGGGVRVHAKMPSHLGRNQRTRGEGGGGDRGKWVFGETRQRWEELRVDGWIMFACQPVTLFKHTWVPQSLIKIDFSVCRLMREKKHK